MRRAFKVLLIVPGLRIIRRESLQALHRWEPFQVVGDLDINNRLRHSTAHRDPSHQIQHFQCVSIFFGGFQGVALHCSSLDVMSVELQNGLGSKVEKPYWRVIVPRPKHNLRPFVFPRVCDSSHKRQSEEQAARERQRLICRRPVLRRATRLHPGSRRRSLHRLTP